MPETMSNEEPSGTPGSPPRVKSERYWEIDAIRGLALFGMLYFHFLAILVMFHILEETNEFLFYYSPIVIVSAAFILIAGVAIVLRYNRMLGKPMGSYYREIAKKALILFFIAMCITALTWLASVVIYNDDVFIKFGFLHMLSISMLISIPLLRFGKWNILFGILIILIGVFIIPGIQDPGWLYPLGIHGADFMDHTPDYFPIFPWSGFILLGVGLGNIFYPKGVRSFSVRQPGILGRFFAKMGYGKVTLIIYLVHMPIFFVILWLLSITTGIGYV